VQTVGGSHRFAMPGVVAFSVSQQATSYVLASPHAADKDAGLRVVSLFGDVGMECLVSGSGACISFCPLRGAWEGRVRGGGAAGD